MPFTAGQTLRAADVATTAAVVATSQTTTSTSYTDLTTAGPAVTVTTGSQVEVTISAELTNSTAGAFTMMGVAVSGATTIAANDADALFNKGVDDIKASFTKLITGLTPGSNTFTAKYKVTGGTGTFIHRNIHVRPA